MTPPPQITPDQPWLRKGFLSVADQLAPVQEYERERLLERIEREGATVGASIPDRITVSDEEFPLKEFVFEVKRLDQVPASKREEVVEAKKRLRRERLARKQTLEEGDITKTEGEELVRSILGIDRALTALESLGPTDIESQIKAKETADKKRWYSFLESVLGRDDTDKRRGVR